VSNALKYGHGGKNIYLSAKKVSNREVEVVVANDGEPIPQSDLRQIFERFYRVEGSRSKETGGTGLGLAIALGIVELHHGYIYASSDEQITKFIMHFPIKHSDTLKAPENVVQA
jgi:signal transduction histidine kinase